MRCRGYVRLAGGACLALAWCSGNARADVLTLSMAQARERAARVSPEVQLAAGRVRQARASRVGAGVIMPVNPRLSVDGRSGLAPNDRGVFGLGSTLDMTFEVGGAPAARVQEAGARTLAASSEREVTRGDARLAAARAYVVVRLAEMRGERAREAIELGSTVLDAAIQRSNTGAGSEIDVTSARAELAQYQSQLYAAQAEQREGEMQLRSLLAIPSGTPLRLSSPLDEFAPAPDIEHLLEHARAHYPELQAIRTHLAMMRASDARLSAEAFPKLGTFLGVDASPLSPVYGLIGVSIELPFAQRNQGPRAVIAAERETEGARYAFTATRLELVLRATRDSYEARRQELSVLTTQGLPAARRHLQLVEIGWRAGHFDIFRLTSAAQSFERIKLARIAVVARLWEQRLLLERLIGGTIDEHA